MTQTLPGRRIAVVLFNLGGPDDQASVKPFLFNLFNDPAIIGLPGIVRTPLAKLISSRREASAQANYALMGGGSPLLPGTRKQAEALEVVLGNRLAGDEVRVFIAMRYWNPRAKATAAEGGSTSSPAWSAAKNREHRLRFLSAYQCGSIDAIAFSRLPPRRSPSAIEAPSFP